MMIKALYICGDVMGQTGGAGAVIKNELQALYEFWGGPERVAVIDGKTVIKPAYQGLDVSFLNDYFALVEVEKPEYINVRHAHFYSGSYTETIKYLKRQGVTVTYTSPAHNREESMKEAATFGQVCAPHIADPELWKQHSECLRLADVVIAPGQAPADYIKSLGRTGQITIIPHGIESIPEIVAPFPKQFTVGYLGASGLDKGLFYLIKAWSDLNLPDAELILAGQGTETLEPWIHREAMRGKFRLLGYVEKPTVLYNLCSVYIQPSLTEGFGIEVPEAMAHGRPVIVSSGAGAADLALMATFVPRDIKKLAGLIKLYYENQDIVVREGPRVRKLAENYTWDKICEKYKEVWQTLFP